MAITRSRPVMKGIGGGEERGGAPAAGGGAHATSPPPPARGGGAPPRGRRRPAPPPPADDEHDGSPADELDDVEHRGEIRAQDSKGRADRHHGRDAVIRADHAPERHQGVADDVAEKDRKERRSESHRWEEPARPD